MNGDRHVDCVVCEKKFHIKCQNISVRSYNAMRNKKENYICSDRCRMSLLPLSVCDDEIDFFLFSSWGWPRSLCCL